MTSNPLSPRRSPAGAVYELNKPPTPASARPAGCCGCRRSATTLRAELASEAAAEQMSYLGFLAELMMAECDDRARRCAGAPHPGRQFPPGESLRAWDHTANPNIDAATLGTLDVRMGQKKACRCA